MMTGSHDASQLPVVMLGKAGGKLQQVESSITVNKRIVKCADFISYDGENECQTRTIRRRDRTVA